MDISDINLSPALEESILETIKNGRLPHAILIDAGSAEKRKALALFFACSFVCSSSDKPCGKCINCKKAAEGVHPDVIVTNPDDMGEKTFKVDVVRSIRKDAYVIPNEADKKVYILRNADKMNTQAQNALLKLIEEPPPYARFILECDSRASMLDTIMSRVTPFNIGADDYAISDSLSQIADDLANSLALALINPTEVEFMKLTGNFDKDKNLFVPAISSLQLIFRDAMVIKAGSNIVLSHHGDTAKKLASKFSSNVIIKLIEKIDLFNKCVQQNANKNLLITRFCSVIRNTAYEG